MAKKTQGKMDTTFEWTCSQCGAENRVVDSEVCPSCGKTITVEKRLRHFKLTPTPVRYGWRGPGKGYTQRDNTKRQRDTADQHAAIVRAVRGRLRGGFSEADAKRFAGKDLDVGIKTVRKVWRAHCKDHPEDAVQI
jgi:ribosomal protein L37E